MVKNPDEGIREQEMLKFINKYCDKESVPLKEIKFQGKEKFKKVWDGSNLNIKNLLIKIIQAISPLGVSHYATDTPDYRFVKNNIFCQVKLIQRPASIQINLRTDSHYLNSEQIPLETMKDQSKPGQKWVTFRISDESLLKETLQLIKRVYDFSE